MRKIFIASHAKLASGILSSAEFLMGKADNITVFDAYLDDRSVEACVEQFLESQDEKDQVILISDLYGGSVNQILYRYLERPNTFLITGANLSLILELMVSKEDITCEELDIMIDSARMMMKRIEFDKETEDEQQLEKEDENDFFS